MSSKEDNRPSIQWYPKEWLSDAAVRACGFAARGLWFDMLNLMWVSPVRGALLMPNGMQMDANVLSKILSADANEVQTLCKELEGNGVFSRLEDGTIINRRMFNQWQKKQDISAKRSKAATSRWCKTHAKHASPTPTPSPTPSPTAKTKESVPNPSTRYPHYATVHFQERYEKHPESRRDGEEECRIAFYQTVTTWEMLQRFDERQKNFLLHMANEEDRFIPLARNWFPKWQDDRWKKPPPRLSDHFDDEWDRLTREQEQKRQKPGLVDEIASSCSMPAAFERDDAKQEQRREVAREQAKEIV